MPQDNEKTTGRLSSRHIPALAALCILLVLVTLPKIDLLFSASGHYAQCSRLVGSDPVKALVFARLWRLRSAVPLARHCEALALFATQNYALAATGFLALANETAAAKPSLAPALYIQAAKAFRASGGQAVAVDALGRALALDPANKEAKALLADIAKENTAPAPSAAPASPSR